MILGLFTQQTLRVNSGKSCEFDGLYVWGGTVSGIQNFGTLDLESCLIGMCSGVSGGGIYNNSGTVTLNYTTVSYNSATAGGGIFNSGGTVQCYNSTIDYNSASSNGGGSRQKGTDKVERERQRRILAVEREVQALELRKQALEHALDAASAKHKVEEIRKLGAEYTAVEGALATKYDEWSSMASEVVG